MMVRLKFNIQLFMIILILLLLITHGQSINQICNTTSPLIPNAAPNFIRQVGNATCPANSHCLSNNYCACDSGYVGGCSQPAYEMLDGTLVSTTITNNGYTFFSITQEIDSYVILIFQICHTAANSNLETIDVWEDKGNIDVLNKSNAISGGKDWDIRQGCLKLSTPLLLFEKQINGLPQSFVLGMKLTQPGSIDLTMRLEVDTIDFWDLFIKFIFIIGGIFLLIFIITIGVFIFKWRRRGMRPDIRGQQNDISHFNNFMPRFKLSQDNRYRTHEQSCAVCLLELGEDEWLRKTICKHVFHQDCIDQWCKNNLNCPICRRSFQLKDFDGQNPTSEQMPRIDGLRSPLIDER